MDPSIPVARALAIAGERVAGGVGTHETALASPERVDLGGRCVLPGFTDAHVHFPTWALAQREVRLEDTASLDEALARVRDGGRAPSSPAAGSAAAAGGAATGRRRRADAPGARRGHRRHAGRADRPRLPLALAQLGRARPGGRRPRGRGRRRRASTPTASRPGVLREESAWRFRDRLPARSPTTSTSTRCATGSGSRRPAASPPCTTRTAGSARCGSGSGSRDEGALTLRVWQSLPARPRRPAARSSGSAPGSATTGCGSAT